MTQNGELSSEIRVHRGTAVYKSELAVLLWHTEFVVVRLTKENKKRRSSMMVGKRLKRVVVLLVLHNRNHFLLHILTKTGETTII
jgi:hypothetical protein